MNPFPVLFGLAVVFCGATARADPNRQLAAELLILQGDARQLWQARAGPEEQQGLRQRIAGALSSLPLALRRAGAEPWPVPAMREALQRDDAVGFFRILQPLIRRHRFDARFMIRESSRERIAAGAQLHTEVCAGCHAAAAGDTLLPARPLQKLAASQSAEEFAARLWLGIRGMREIAYANPFTDEELAALFAYYRSP
ncbi:MAG: c-type cytochrome [Rhodocyclaceae bacterium]